MSKSRKPISKKKRFDVFKRDGFACQYCGATPPNAVLHVDHIIAVAEGGGNDITNLTTSCAACNLGKGARPLSSIPRGLKEQAAEAEERMAQAAGYAEAIQAERDAIEAWAWDVAEIIKPGASKGYSRNNFGSIVNFIRRIGYGNTLEAARIAADRWPQGPRRFKYFCGICWRMNADQAADE